MGDVFPDHGGNSPGDELFARYQDAPNGKMLLQYGFSVPNNPFDYVPVRIELPEVSDAIEERRHALLERLGGMSPVIVHAQGEDTQFPDEVWPLLTVLVLTKAELLGDTSSVISAPGVLGRAQDFLRRSLETRSAHIIGGKPTDDRLLSSDNLEAPMRYALMARSNEKRLLQGAIDVLLRQETAEVTPGDWLIRGFTSMMLLSVALKAYHEFA